MTEHIQSGNLLSAEEARLELRNMPLDATTNVDAKSFLDTNVSLMKRWLEQEDVVLGTERADRILASLVDQHSLFESGWLTSEVFLLVLKAWSSLASTEKGAPQRAQQILETMESISPDALTSEAYDLVIEAWANSSEHLRATMAHHAHKKLVDKSTTTRQFIRPTPETYGNLIRVWCESTGERRAAFNATNALSRKVWLLRDDHPEMEPTLEEYQMILKAWVTAEDKLAPGKAQTVFRFMEETYEERLTTVRPDVSCFRYLLQCLASSSESPVGKEVDDLLYRMRDREILPDTECYRSAIRAHSNAASQKDCLDPVESARRAHLLLEEMSQAYLRSAVVTVEPSTLDYDNVLRAWKATKGAPVALMRSEALLMRMEQLGKEVVAPSAESYASVLTIIAKASVEGKMESASSLLARFEERTKTKNLKPTVEVYNAYVTVCSSMAESSNDGMSTLRQAVSVVDGMYRSAGIEPNTVTYRLLLNAATKLLPNSNERSRAARKIFETCCMRGLLTKEVLERFRRVAPAELFADVVLEKARNLSGIGMAVPESWTRRIDHGIAKLEKKPRLTVDGFYMGSIESKERQMTTLRSQANQKFLRGGRMQYKGKYKRVASK
uniref:Pentacotripeptide-repeat region of PRORP domain-containing protein n=1 Tax=Grammatophora oceanica TaxID=210454 RepID=A0A7S1UTN1_9STRA